MDWTEPRIAQSGGIDKGLTAVLAEAVAAMASASCDADRCMATLASHARGLGFDAGALLDLSNGVAQLAASFGLTDGASFEVNGAALIRAAARALETDAVERAETQTVYAFASSCGFEKFALALEVRKPKSPPQDAWPIVSALAILVGSALRSERLGIEAQRSLAGAIDAAERLTFAADAAALVVWDWDATTGDVVHSQARAIENAPVRSREDLAERMHPDDRARVRAEFDRCAASGEPYSQDYRLVLPSGEVRWVMSRGRRAMEPNGRARMTGVIVDITERRRAERDLIASERRFRAVFHEQPEWMALLDPEGRVSDVAHGALARAGFRPQDVLGRYLWDGPFWSAPHLETDRARMHAAVREALEAGEASFETAMAWGREPGVRRVSGMIKAVRDESGAVAFLIAQASDVTEQARAALDMARQNAELTLQVEHEVRRREATQDALLRAHRLEALSHLAGGLAHDFNNLLAAVIGAFNIIERSAESERLRGISRQGIAAAQRGVQLVRQMRAFARRDALRLMPLDLKRHLHDAAAPNVARTLGPAIELDLEIADGLWPVMMDPDQLDLALVNLAANARDAMEDGGRVVLRAENVAAEDAPEAIGPCVKLALIDEGGGMGAEVMRRAVEPFFTTKEPGRASGLGLAMVHGFARQTGGALVLDNVGRGVSAALYVPRTRALEQGQEPSRAASIRTRANDAPPRRVLLVDDDENLRVVASALLADLGLVVDAASNAAEARALFRPRRYDLVLTDVIMPGGDGVSLARDLRGRDPGAVVAFMTGHAGDEARLAGEAVLRKPFSAEDLAAFLALDAQEGS